MNFLVPAAVLSMSVLLLGIAVALGRFVRGPSVPDRVAALDVIGVLGMGWMGCLCAATGSAVFLDPAVMLGLVAFLGTAAFARYLEAKKL